jgi:hypothetical protein
LDLSSSSASDFAARSSELPMRVRRSQQLLHLRPPGFAMCAVDPILFPDFERLEPDLGGHFLIS